MKNLIFLVILLVVGYAFADPNTEPNKPKEPNNVTVNVYINTVNIQPPLNTEPQYDGILGYEPPKTTSAQRQAEFLERKKELRDQYLLRQYARQFERQEEGRDYIQQRARFRSNRDFYSEYYYGNFYRSRGW